MWSNTHQASVAYYSRRRVAPRVLPATATSISSGTTTTTGSRRNTSSSSLKRRRPIIINNSTNSTITRPILSSCLVGGSDGSSPNASSTTIRSIARQHPIDDRVSLKSFNNTSTISPQLHNYFQRLQLQQFSTTTIRRHLQQQQQQQQQQEQQRSCNIDYDEEGNNNTSVATRHTTSNTPTSSSMRSTISLYNMNAFRIKNIDKVDDLIELVSQLESLPQLTREDIGPLILPLSRKTCMYEFGRDGALLTERILFNLLSRLSPQPEPCTSSAHGAQEETRLENFLPYPPTTLYNRAMIAWGNTNSKEGALRSQRIFDLMLEQYYNHLDQSHEPNESLHRVAKPDRRTYKSLLRSWAVSNAPEGPARAYEILMEMERLSGVDTLLGQKSPKQSKEDQNQHPFKIGMPDRSVYNSVLSVYSRAFVLRNPHSLNRVKSIMSRMDALAEATRDDDADDAGKNKINEYSLDSFSYHAILRAYSRFVAYAPEPLPPNIVEEVETILNRLMMSRRDDNNYYINRGPSSPRKQFQGNDEIFTLPWACGIAVEAWLKTEPLHTSIYKAHNYILAMANKKEAGATTNVDVPEGSSIRAYEIYPHQETIMKVVRKWERTGIPEAQTRIDELVNIAVDFPFTRIFYLNQACEKWIRSGWDHAPELVEKMLERAWQQQLPDVRLKPTGQTFAIAMKAWLRSKKDEAPYRTELLFHKMHQVYLETKDRYYEPREEHIRYLMTAWMLRCRDGQRYEDRLRTTTSGTKYNDFGDEDDGGVMKLMYPAEHMEAFVHWLRNSELVMTNIIGMYSMAIRAWAIQVIKEEDGSEAGRSGTTAEGKHQEPNPVRRAAALLKELAEYSDAIKLSPYPCNWVLRTCCREQPTLERRKEAYDTAVNTFRLGYHNALTFVLMVQVFKSQLPDSELDEKHIKIIEELFQECCSRGLLSQDMIWHVVEVASAESLQRLFGLSYQYASFIVRGREQRAMTSDDGTLGWCGRDEAPPSSLMVENLPQGWSSNARRQGPPQQRKEGSKRRPSR